MNRRSLVLPLAALLLTACSSDAARNPLAPSGSILAARGSGVTAMQAKSIHGTLEAVETGVLQPGTTLIVTHLEGEGTASHLGRYTAVADFTVNFATASGSGRFTFTAANGDILTGTDIGQAVVTAGIAAVTETITIMDGTGRFANATGTITLVRRVVQATGVSSGSFDGTIYLAK